MNPSDNRSRLFLVRLWLERRAGEKHSWRGEIKTVETGERRFFRDWQTLVRVLSQTLRGESEKSGGDSNK